MKLISWYDCTAFSLFLMFIGGSRANFLSNSSPLQQDGICSIVYCGQGTCKPSGALYDCECYPGWKKLGSFSPCIIPNCTLNFDCSVGGAPTQASSPPSTVTPQSPFNISNPCSFAWCGDGVCLTNGTGYMCQCNLDASNLRNLTSLPCVKSCSLGTDCTRLGLEPFLSPFFPQPSSPDPSDTTSSNGSKGSSKDTNSAATQYMLILLPLAAISLAML